MIEVYDKVFVGAEMDCRNGSDSWAVIHACKYPCHRDAVGYTKKISPNHPNYLVLERGLNLYLNIIDPDQPLFMPPLFIETIRFSRMHADSARNLLFHCNQGDSRAPSLAMLHLAKNLGVLDSSSYDLAVADFAEMYPRYNPGLGIRTYLREHWHDF